MWNGVKVESDEVTEVVRIDGVQREAVGDRDCRNERVVGPCGRFVAGRSQSREFGSKMRLWRIFGWWNTPLALSDMWATGRTT